jgi:endonuclease-3 related protein
MAEEVGAAGRPPLREVFDRLLAAYGPQGWWPGSHDPFEVIAGAILTQQTAWTNVERALANLRAASALSPAGMHGLPEPDLAALIRPSGYYQAKARKLKAFTALVYERFGGELAALLATPEDELRPLLLATHGIGPETADSILLYAAERPYFVVDAYAKRVFRRLGMGPAHDTYESWQRWFMGALPADAPFFNEYHALIVEHGKRACRKEPLCEGCVLRDVCDTGRAA